MSSTMLMTKMITSSYISPSLVKYIINDVDDIFFSTEEDKKFFKL